MWTLRDARNRFSTVVPAALSGTPQAVTRRGKPAVVVLSDTAYRHPLAQTKRARGAIVVTADVAHFEPTGVRIEHPFASPSPAPT